MTQPNPIITLTTDFGLRDSYVAEMKGVLLSRCPNARLVDLSHEIAAQDISEAAFFISNAALRFPSGSIHVVVVDPGVGTSRHAIALSMHGQYFVGPDNGVFGLLLAHAHHHVCHIIDATRLGDTPPSATFHGRDIFAPAAAFLGGGRELHELGERLESPATLHWPEARMHGPHAIAGEIVHIDHFGNAITNVWARQIAERTIHRVRLPNRDILGLVKTYGDVCAGESLAIIGSSDLLEIAVNGGRADTLLELRKGQPVTVEFAE